MKIELPLETWTQLFGFVSRLQLMLLVSHFGDETYKTIGNRQFVSFVQFFLHKCGEVTIRQLRIRSSKNGNGPIIAYGHRELPLADAPISANIKNFKSIIIYNIDEPVIAFLQKFQQNSLLDNVNLYLHDCWDILFQILTNFMPLFTNIHSIDVNMNNSFVLDQLQSEYSELATPMFTSARVLTADYNCRDIWFCDWLHIPREDGKPRVLILDGCRYDYHLSSLTHFIKHIKKDFLEANRAVSFFIKLKKFRDDTSVQSLTLENGQTREKLVINGIILGRDYVSISRYSMGTNEEDWIEEMEQRLNTDNRIIKFDNY